MKSILNDIDEKTLIEFAKSKTLTLSEITNLSNRIKSGLVQFHKELKIMGCSGFLKFYTITSILSDIMDTCNMYGIKND